MSHRLKRRDFLQAFMGTTGLAVGCTSSGMVEAMFAGSASASRRSWWVEPVDRPVLEIDNNVYNRFDQHKNVLNAFREYVSPERFAEVQRKREDIIRAGKEGNIPGYRWEEIALRDAGWTLRATGNMNKGLRSWVRKSRRPLPKERWQATPARAARTIKKAARFFGAADTGIALLDRRHIFSRSYGVDVVFEDVDQPYDVENEKAVIPDKVKYAIAVVVRMSPETADLAPSPLCDSTTSLGYSRLEFTVGLLAEFIRNLGYVAIPSVNGMGSSIPFAVDAGLGEVGRTNRFISPIFGPAVQLGKVLTDMPMEVDEPIRFGLKEFCIVCGRCAEACPSKALSFNEQPNFETRGEWNNPGHQTWYEDSVKCYAFWDESNSYCSVCIMVCPWAKKDKTLVHEIVRASSAKFPVLDRYLTSLDKAFGYGQAKNPDEWWDLDLNEHGLDYM